MSRLKKLWSVLILLICMTAVGLCVIGKGGFADCRAFLENKDRQKKTRLLWPKPPKRGQIMALKKLTDFLDQNHIRYMTIIHSPAYTSQEIAEAARIPGKVFAKSVLVKYDGELAMAVLPASYQIDFRRLKELTGEDVVLADEEEFKDRFPECEIGAMPPFGNLWNMKVWVSESIADDEEIVFEAGSHSELVRMNYKDFEQLVRPQVMPFSCKTHPSKEEMDQGKYCY